MPMTEIVTGVSVTVIVIVTLPVAGAQEMEREHDYLAESGCGAADESVLEARLV